MADEKKTAQEETAQKKTAKTPRCPQCGKPRQQDYRPFCSARCRDLDLGKWLNGSYAIPAVEADEEFPEEELSDGLGGTER